MRKVLAIVLVLVILLASIYLPVGTVAAITMPTEIKVGIQYDDALKYTSLSEKVKLKATSGIKVTRAGKSLMTFGANAVVHIFSTTHLLTEITVKSPAHLAATAALSPTTTPKPTVTPKPTTTPTPTPTPTPTTAGGYKIIKSKTTISLTGRYHLNINHLFPDLKSVQAYLAKMDAGGIYAFPLYMSAGWHVCLGGYSTEDLANNAVTRLKKENTWLKTTDLDVFNPETITNKTAYCLKKDDGKLAMMVYIGANKLEFEPVTAGGTINLYFGTTPKEYRGTFQVFRASGKSFTVVNIVPFEEYLCGVIPAEIGGSAPTEALKAQAVASRTYAYNQMFPKSYHAASGFDICATVHCHVYKGKSAETTAANNAVKATAGEMVYYKGALAKVFYYSSNGGSTENVKYVWGSSFPYLISAVDKYETPTTSNYTWTRVVSAVTVSAAMIRRGEDLGTINDIRIIERTPAGRPYHVQVLGTKGVENIPNESCRTFLGLPSQLYTLTTNADTNVLSSGGKIVKTRLASLTIQSASQTTSFDISSQKVTILSGSGATDTVPTRPTTYTFNGRGWGHAVGMSQNGAMGRANKGFHYDEILKFYFPGTTIE